MNIRSITITLFATLWFLLPAAHADVRLAPLIQDNMVLQREAPIPIWGWDKPSTEVTVTLDQHTVTAQTDADGKWVVQLPKMKAGGPHRLTVSGSSTVTIKNILVGEVWLCSGQSNMEWTVRGSANPDQEIAAGDHPQIRHIKISHRPSKTPQEHVPTKGWQVCSPKTVGDFTAVGYYFARQLQQELNVPVGLIGSNWGGTRIEPWTPSEGFQQVPALKEIADRLDQFPQVRENGAVHHQSPLALYNGMIHPLVPYRIAGALWYQGESNNGEGATYHEKMKALISGWRTVWQREDLPFYFVQLAPFNYRGDPTRLAEIWEAQAMTLAVPHTGMAVTTDIGNLRDIHPRNKQEVGRRLALWALAKNYGHDDLVYSGPLYRSHQVEGAKIRIKFDHVGGGLASRDDKPLTRFTIAGSDKKFVEATAEIDGDSILVSSPDIQQPVAVRFGWHQSAEPNLVNKQGLPASPFRTDQW